MCKLSYVLSGVIIISDGKSSHSRVGEKSYVSHFYFKIIFFSLVYMSLMGLKVTFLRKSLETLIFQPISSYMFPWDLFSVIIIE